jgi:hypothetical protein
MASAGVALGDLLISQSSVAAWLQCADLPFPCSPSASCTLLLPPRRIPLFQRCAPQSVPTHLPASQSTRRSFLVPNTAGPRTRWVPWQGPRLSFQGARSLFHLLWTSSPQARRRSPRASLFLRPRFFPFQPYWELPRSTVDFCLATCGCGCASISAVAVIDLSTAEKLCFQRRLWLQQRLGLGPTLLLQLYSFNCVCNDAFDSLRLNESRLGALTSDSCPSSSRHRLSFRPQHSGPRRAWTDRCYRIQTSANPEIKVHSTGKTTWRPL